MTWPIIATAVISFASGAALATWWHRTEPERRRRIGELLAEICEGID